MGPGPWERGERTRKRDIVYYTTERKSESTWETQREKERGKSRKRDMEKERDSNSLAEWPYEFMDNYHVFGLGVGLRSIRTHVSYCRN